MLRYLNISFLALTLALSRVLAEEGAAEPLRQRVAQLLLDVYEAMRDSAEARPSEEEIDPAFARVLAAIRG